MATEVSRRALPGEGAATRTDVTEPKTVEPAELDEGQAQQIAARGSVELRIGQGR